MKDFFCHQHEFHGLSSYMVLLIYYHLCRYTVLGSTDSTDIGNIGDVQWHLVACLLLGWLLVYICIIKGVKSSGKVSRCNHFRSSPKPFFSYSQYLLQ